MAVDDPEIRISEVADWQLFDRVAQALQRQFGGTWSAQLDGIDQRYWDLEVADAWITLHLEHYLGISVSIAPDAPDPLASRRLLGHIAAFVSSGEWLSNRKHL
jgi:hypothetical protein